jgi:23S rRNA pseudouridine1911/1915/1917 synthase
MSNLEFSRAKRLDTYVAEKLPEYSRAYVAKLVDQGIARVNGEVVTKGGYKLKHTDEIEIDHLRYAPQPVPNIELEVIYEDDDCVVINKPAGVLSHSKGEHNPEATVASWLRSRTSNMSGERAGIVHRLDRATSGVMICAKNKEASSWLQKQFAVRKVKKTYVAIIQGSLDPAQAMIDMPIERNPKKPQTFRVGSNGKPSQTEYRIIKSNAEYSLVELKPTTGRTHQLRVHMEKLGHPIVGDTLYAGQTANRMYLHAKTLEITLPNHKRAIFEAKVPKEFNDLI